MWITQPPKFLVKLSENLRIFQTNGTVIQKFLGNISSFEQLFYRKKSLGAPEQLHEFALVKVTKYHESQPGN